MYLSILKETEKELFLNLAYALSCADGNTTNEEKTMLDCYCDEMGIVGFTPSITDQSELIKQLIESADLQSKKIIIFELIGLAMTDSRYEESEKVFIANAASKFNLPSNYINKCEAIIAEYLSFQNKINDLVVG